MTFAGVLSSKIAVPLRLDGAAMWAALKDAPTADHLRMTVGGVRESSATKVSEMVARSTDIEDLCRSVGQPLTVYAPGVNTWHPGVVLQLCSAYGDALWDHGLTDGESRCDIFAGDYSSTPGGIHREPCRNRHLIVQGGKCFYFWDHTDVESAAPTRASRRTRSNVGRSNTWRRRSRLSVNRRCKSVPRRVLSAVARLGMAHREHARRMPVDQHFVVRRRPVRKDPHPCRRPQR